MLYFKHRITSRLYLLTPVLLFSATTSLFATEDIAIIAGPYLQHVTQTSIVIMWETNIQTTSNVNFGKARVVTEERKSKAEPEAPLDQLVSSDKMTTIHELKLEGLEPQTDYFYRVSSVDRNGEMIQSEIYIFQTAVLIN